MPNDTLLFEAFPPVTAEQWIQQAIKDLKGQSFGEKLQYTTADGIRVNPFYTEEDLAMLPACPPLFTHADWDVCEVIRVTDADEANKKALHALNNGATGLVLHLAADTDLTSLFRDIELPYIFIHFTVTGTLSVFHQNLQLLTTARGIGLHQLNISINADFIASLMQEGNWIESEQNDRSAWKQLFSGTAPLRSLCVDGTLYHNAGAPPAYQLACILAQVQEYIGIADTDTSKDLAGSIQINIAVGADYFFEIAKLRALRKVFTQLLEAYNTDPTIRIHAETASRHLTIYDAYNNLLRTTTSAMAATIGGCNSLAVTPFDTTFGSATPFSERMARNIQLILKAESYFDKVSDVSAGSYFIETLTEQLAEKAWSLFTEIEKNGGLIACLKQGIIQAAISGFAQEEQDRFDQGQDILVGTNKFPDPKETMQGKQITQPVEKGNKPDQVIVPLDIRRISCGLEAVRMESEKKGS